MLTCHRVKTKSNERLARSVLKMRRVKSLLRIDPEDVDLEEESKMNQIGEGKERWLW